MSRRRATREALAGDIQVEFQRRESAPTVTALDGAQGCVMGCVAFGQHLPACPCHDQCPDHEGHCSGCAPRPAHGQTLLCGRCFFRRLRSPLRQLPTLYAWLGDRMGGIKAASTDPHIGGSRDAPMPINAAMHDLRATMNLLGAAWANQIARQHKPAPLAAPDRWTIAGTAPWIDGHAGFVSTLPTVPILIGHVQELSTRAAVLAPWRRERKNMPMPCPRCNRLTLVFFGGDDWVSCTASGCEYVVSVDDYRRLQRLRARMLARDDSKETA